LLPEKVLEMKSERGLSITTRGAEDDALPILDKAFQSGEFLPSVAKIRTTGNAGSEWITGCCASLHRGFLHNIKRVIRFV
jgi:hypothetical protein